ncbi:hypothetical protein ONS96_007363 [Cadophora gregata f. sp. sojae]|nr:hypothetical protein ONS96_007363 [Cadophora gregata f. sp. sojae]
MKDEAGKAPNASCFVVIYSRPDQVETGVTTAIDFVPEVGQSAMGTSSVHSAEATHGQSVNGSSTTNDSVSPSGQLAAEPSSANPPTRPTEEPLTVATSVAVDALAYFVNEVLYMNINGYDYPYRNQDILDAQSHGIALEQWVLWKFENGVDRAALCG